LGEFDRPDTQVLGVSVDSIHCHGNWAKSMGGVTFPLLADFHPKGDMAKKYGVYLEDKGITDRATVIVNKNGVVRYAKSVTPAGSANLKIFWPRRRRSTRARDPAVS
jgi:alkyl hydroperoxide reductase subunit AhpC